jgi:hypothetical protein
LPHYIAPAFPALAVIAGMWIADWIAAVQSNAVKPVTALAMARHGGASHDWEERWLDWGWGTAATIGVCLLILLPSLTRHFAPEAPNFNWIGLILLVGAVAGWLCQRWRRQAAAAASMVLTHAVLFVCLFAVAAVPFSEQQTSVRMLNSIRRMGAESATIGTCRLFLPGLFFYADFDHPIIQVKKEEDARTLFGSVGRSVLITDVDGFEELGSLVPDDARVVERQTRYLKGTQLLIVESDRPPSDDAPVPATAAAPAADLK